VRFGSFFFMYVVFGLSDVSTVLGTLCCLGIWAGITMARPELFALTALVLGIFAGFNILMVRAIFAWIDRWLAQRKTREILGAIFMVLILSVQLFNPALHQKRHQGPINPEERAQSYNRLIASPWLKTANAVQQWLPPGLAALALRQSVTQQSTQALGSLGVLGLYVLGAGAVLALRVRGEYRGENLGAAPSVKKAVPKKKRADASERIAASGHIKATSGEDKWHLSVPGVIAAILDKEFRSLFRTLPLLYSIGAPLLLVLVFSGAFIRGGAPQGHMFRLALPLCMVYAQLGFMRLFFNNLGTEGPGIQLYFLSPTPIRTVLLAKNLFHSLLFGFAIVMAGVLATLRLGRPDGVVVAATIAWLLFALPCNLVVGNVFSLTMPYRVNPGRISRQRGSQANGFLTLLVQAAILAVGATVFGICLIVDRLWLAVPVFLVLSAVAVLVWMRMLRNANDMANNRKDLLIATLMKTE
jgi:ABC-2 type transport system permease protein